MRIIPAIDIINGKCVRLAEGNYDSMIVYDTNPIDVARRFEQHGFKFLHLVDLDGARECHIVNYKVLESITSGTSLSVDFGGGIKTDDDIKIAFNSGATAATIGSVAVLNRGLFLDWLEAYGDHKIILGADCKERKIMTSGWTQKSGIDVVEYISGYSNLGVRYAACTDISRDGMMKGPSIGLYEEILAVTEINLIASGGVTSLEDVKMLKDAGCEGVIIGKAIYEGKINLEELSKLC